MRPEPEYILIGRVAQKLLRAEKCLCTAESCTGGLIAALCTDIAGSSGWFKGGVVAYSNDIKEGVLGVPPALITAHGAVSCEVVEAMARGALEALGADVALATSGIAGPGGGTPEKPVGTVWMAVAVREAHGQRVESFVEVFPGTREAVRRAAAMAVCARAEAFLD